MDESEFLESLKTEEDRFNELTAGAEHFIRLKKQSGYEQPVVPEAPEKTASLRSAFNGARSSLEQGARGLKRDIKGALNNKASTYSRSFDAGRVVGKAAPVVAGGAVAHALGKHQGKRESEREIFGDLAEKRASAAEKLKSIGPLTAALMGAGALTGGVGTYLSSRPQEDLDGKSKAEDELETQVRAHQGRPENGLLRKLMNRTTELEHGYAKAFRDHPGKASILGAGAGAAGGYGLARLLDAVRSTR